MCMEKIRRVVCVWNCMMYGSETWLVKYESMLERTEIVPLQEGRKPMQCWRIGIAAIVFFLKRNRLRWVGHAERKEKEDYVRKCMYMEVDWWSVHCARPRKMPRKIWLEGVKDHIKSLGQASADALDWYAWRRKIVEIHADPYLLGAPWDSSQDEWAFEWCGCVFIVNSIF